MPYLVENEPEPDKANYGPVCPAKTQISLGIHPIWSESSLSVWRRFGPLATHKAYSEDWSDEADLSLCWVRRSYCWFCDVLAQMLSVWMHYSMVKPLCTNLGWLQQIFSGVRIFRTFTVFHFSTSIRDIWAAWSEFVSLSIPSWQILTAHAQPFREARDLAFYLKVPLDSLLEWASSEGSGETVRRHRLAWTFAARIGDKYQIRLTRPIY